MGREREDHEIVVQSSAQLISRLKFNIVFIGL